MEIVVKGAREHNLKGIDITITSGELTLITGVSGSGKSTLIKNILYAQSQKRYIESFSPYSRIYMEKFGEANFDAISNITPSILIERGNQVRTLRSTLATRTEISDYVKLLYYNIGELYCSYCDIPLIKDDPYSVTQKLLSQFAGEKLLIGFYPLQIKEENLKGHYIRRGFSRIYTKNGDLTLLEDSSLEEFLNSIVIVDRILVQPSKKERLLESTTVAFKEGEGRIVIVTPQGNKLNFSDKLQCPKCKRDYKDRRTPSLFSFNTPQGACPECKGFGYIIEISERKVIPNPELSIREGAIKIWANPNRQYEYRELIRYCNNKGIDINKPWRGLPEEQKQKIWNGDGAWWGIKGWVEWLESETYKVHIRILLSKIREYKVCPVCEGTRFNSLVLKYKINGVDIAQFYRLTIEEALEWLKNIKKEEKVEVILKAIKTRLEYLLEVGLGYLTLDRPIKTLSWGEAQRVTLTVALGTSLTNILYLLDEPTTGLHPEDVKGLVQALRRIARLDNFVVIVDNNPILLWYADKIIELGPRGGSYGGKIIATGDISSIIQSSESNINRAITLWRELTNSFEKREPDFNNVIVLKEVKTHNLKNVTVRFPRNCITLITGVSGSGKSSLIMDSLIKFFETKNYNQLSGIKENDEILFIPQANLGRTSRGNVATYTGIWEEIRKLFIELPLSKSRKYTLSHFSFNVDGGRCEYCKGSGIEEIEMQFLADIEIVCPVCKGKKFKDEILEVKYKGLNIAELLELTVEEAKEVFLVHKKLKTELSSLIDIGLGYLKLGQPLSSLSTGESQRLKLIATLKDTTPKNSIIILDEPSVGLHPIDLANVVRFLKKLSSLGATIILVDHNLLFAFIADYIIDLGPGAGVKGGEVVASGTIYDIIQEDRSITGKYLSYIKDEISNYWLLGRLIKLSEEKLVDTYKDSSKIVIKGAREHNLKNIDVEIPRNKLVVISGPSGSGKSTLAFNILHSECQRRFLESLDPYTRQFLPKYEKPNVKEIYNLSPSIDLPPRTYYGRGTTVGTLTEVSHYLRLLFAKVGIQYCPECKVPIKPLSLEEIKRISKELIDAGYKNIWARVVYKRKGIYTELREILEKSKAELVRIDGVVYKSNSNWVLDRYKEHTIDIKVGEGDSKDDKRLEELIKNGLKYGGGHIIIEDGEGKKSFTLSEKRGCPNCGRGFFDLDPRMFSYFSGIGRCSLCSGVGYIDSEDKICPSCNGTRLNEISRSVFIGKYNFCDIIAEPIENLPFILNELLTQLKDEHKKIASSILKDIVPRIEFLKKVRVGYLTLQRAGYTLSGGETQRVRLASQLGSGISGIIYVLDEPTIGLHPIDTTSLYAVLKEITKRGSTVIVVEHDEFICKNSDYIVDLGPGGGIHGGNLLYQGPTINLFNVDTPTSIKLREKRSPLSTRRKPIDPQRSIILRGARLHNLKNITVSIPLNCLVVVAGVSGSGKSTLIQKVLCQAVKNVLKKGEDKLPYLDKIEGVIGNIKQIVEIDQSPIGKTSRSIPATYLKIWDKIRTLLSLTPEAKVRGFSPSTFSFNKEGGRCENCKGLGLVKLEMQFLPDLYVRCEICEGKRFKEEVLNVYYKGVNVYQLLELTIEEAKELFRSHKDIYETLLLMEKVGLSYIKLGQPSPTLSGGEAQRLKIVSEIRSFGRKDILYILDEPTTGLHLVDVEKLITNLRLLVDKGNSVVVIEHHPDVIVASDYIIELGPEGGEGGGYVIAEGPPEYIAEKFNTPTAQVIKKFFEK